MSSPPAKGLRSLTATVALAAVAVAGITAAPAAVAAGGAATLALNGPAAKSLRESGIRIGPLKPARGGGQRIVLPIAAGLAGSETTLLRYRGGISLRGDGGRKLRLTQLSLVLGPQSRLKAKAGGKTIDFFRILAGGKRSVDPAAGTAKLSGLRLKLTGAGARAIAELHPSLQPRSLRRMPFGGLSAKASGLLAGGSTSSPGAAGGGAAAGSSGCPQPASAGPAPEDPLPVATRPAGAADVTSATIDWHVRESFIRYIGTGEGTSVSGGASADPPVQLPGTSASLAYTFHFPFAEGWHDAGANPADPADDTATVEFGGAVRFLYSDHEIDLTTANPEIEIAGARSRAIFTISEGSDPGQRQVLVNLDLSRAAATTASGNSFAYERVPAAIPAGTASSVFAGFYAPGTEFGCVTVSLTTGS